ncbi:hypothetical protein BPIT_20510 [Candidatus Brocadia pituitae]|nr:hypothetical protein BPIT_20510 [Candidatus Brocadia pituitae]
MAAYGPNFGPNNSNAIILAAIGMLAAPAKRLTKPSAEKVALSTPDISEKKLPEVAPIKTIGVTIPVFSLKILTCMFPEIQKCKSHPLIPTMTLNIFALVFLELS